MTPKVPVTFVPSGTTVWVEPGTTLLEAARAGGIAIAATCGGRGTCGTCATRVMQGQLSEMDAVERGVLGRAPVGVRLACRARVVGAATVRALTVGSAAPPPDRVAGTHALVAGVDLGTTNVSALVVERDTGREVGRATVPNRQQSWGADVLSRVSAALGGSAEPLRQAAEDSVVEALEVAAGPATAAVERLVIAGNSAMAALLTGSSVASLATAPFTAPQLPACPPLPGVRSSLAQGCEIEVVGPLAAFVGGDVLAGLVAVRTVSCSEPVMLVDIGTNAEVALWSHGVLTVASAPAGPAFEGVGVSCGGPAVDGAVVRVIVGDEEKGDSLVLETIGGVAATWMTGAGLVSAVALLRRLGHITPDGALVESGRLSSRFFRDERGVLCIDLGDEDHPIVLSQFDVRTLQLAKAAVRVAIEGVLRAAGVGASSLARLWVAGAFGGALEARELVALGLVPCAARDAIEAPGNTALLGAVALAADVRELANAAELVKGVSAVELATDPDFAASLMRAVELGPFDC